MSKCHSEEWLRKQYVKGKTTPEIAELCGISMERMDKRINRKGIKKYKSKKWLKRQYVEKERSVNEIAEIANISTTTVKDWLKRNDIQVRKGTDGRANPEIKKVVKMCEYCGETYIGHPQSKYCSDKCRTLAFVNPDYYSVFYRDHFRCRYCGRTPADGIKLTIDHVYPEAHGGSEDKINLVTACKRCNSYKGETVWDEKRIKEIWWQNKKLREKTESKSYEEIKKEFKNEYPEVDWPLFNWPDPASEP